MPFSNKLAGTAGRINRVLERLMPILTPGGLVVGLLFFPFFLKFRPFIPLIFGMMTLSGALALKVRDLGLAVSRPLPIIFFLVSARIISPLLVLFLSSLVFGNDADTISGYVLIYAAPTAVSGFIWVSVFRGDVALTLALILLDTILAPVVVPGTVRFLLGTRVVLDMSGMALSLIYMVVIPTVIGVALNEITRGKAPRIAGPFLAPLAKLCMILVVSANSAAVASQIDFTNPRFWLVGAVCVFLSVAGFMIGKIAGLLGRFSRDKQVSLFFALGLHNISAAMTLGIEFFPGPAALPSVLGIMFQQSICAIMGRLMIKEAKGK